MDKQCSVCGIAQPLSQYQRDSQKSSGYRPSCKTCERERYLAKRAAGVCTRCGANSGGKSRCDPCMATNDRNRPVRRAELDRLGACRDCGDDAVVGLTRCERCRQSNMLHGKSYYATRDTSACWTCGAGVAAPATACASCAQLSSEASRERRQSRIESGVCQTCGTSEPAPERTQCSDCLARASESQRGRRDAIRAYSRRRYAEAVARGQCAYSQGRCKAPATSGLLCEEHARLNNRGSLGRRADRHRAVIFDGTADLCHLCLEPIDFDTDAVHADHMQPRVHGGTDDWWNLRWSHASCNLGPLRLVPALDRLALVSPLPAGLCIRPEPYSASPP